MPVLLFTLTYYGWGFIILLLFSAFLTTLILKRSEKNSKAGCLGWAYIFTILCSLNLFACFLSFALLQKSTTFFTGKMYSAKVVDAESYLSTTTDSDNRKRTITMYTPVLSFTTSSGKGLTRKDNVSSGERPTMGKQVTIYYNEDTDELEELSLANIGLLIAGLFFSFISALIIIGATRYAFNKNVRPITNLLKNILLMFVLPAGMLFLALGMGWYVYQRLANGYKADQPIWVLAICIFFTLMLAFALAGYTKMMFSKKAA